MNEILLPIVFIVLAIALVQTPVFARIVRASTLSVKEVEYVHSAVTAGARPDCCWAARPLPVRSWPPSCLKFLC